MLFYCRSVFALLFSFSIVHAVQAQSFESLLESALRHNRSLAAGYQEWQARKQSAEATGFLPDPMISIDYFSTPIETRTGPQQQRLMLEQKLPWFGTRHLQKSEKNQQAQTYYWQWQFRQLDIQRQLAQLYGELFYWHQASRIAHHNVQLLQELEAIVRSRYQVAAATQSDLIRIQIEAGKALDRVVTLEQQKSSLQARLELLTGKEQESNFMHLAKDLPVTYTLPSHTVLAAQVQSHPSVKQQHAADAAAKTLAQLASKRYGPDVTLRYGHLFTGDALNPAMKDSGKDPEYWGVALNIPLWTDQYDADRKAALSRALSAQEQGAYIIAQLHAQLEQGLYLLQDGDRKVKLYRDELLPKTDEALQGQLRAYQTSESGFLDLLETEKQQLELQLLQVQAEQQRWNAYHSILLATGQLMTIKQAGEQP